jgi:hypothetical protein
MITFVSDIDAGGEATYLRSTSPDTVYYDSTRFNVGINSVPSLIVYRGLIRFSLRKGTNPIGSRVKINSANMVLTKDAGSFGAGTYYIYPCIKLWKYGEATYNSYVTGTSWDVAGGDFTLPAIASGTYINTGVNESAIYTFSQAGLTYLEELSSERSNGWFLMKPLVETGGTSTQTFSSFYNATPEFRPKLTIEYEPYPFMNSVFIM